MTPLLAAAVAASIYVWRLPPTVTEPTANDYAVFSAFVDGFVSSDQPVRVDPRIALEGVVYIANQTLPMKSPGSILPLEIAALGPNDMGEDFFRQNNQAWALQPRFHSRVRVSLVGSASLRGLAVFGSTRPADQSEANRERGSALHAGPVHPSPDDAAVPGVLRLSRPGFSRSGNVALVYYSYRCGTLCGQSGLAVLRKTGGQWRLQQFGRKVIY